MDERFKKALTERIFLLSAKQEAAKWTFEVQGSKGTTHKITVTPEKLACSCPDSRTRKATCKHMLFIKHRVALGTPNDDPWNNADYAAYTSAWRARLRARAKAAEPIPASAEPPKNEDCSICFEKMETADELCSCETQCHKWFHSTCIEAWIARSPHCPLCRTAWPVAAPTTGRNSRKRGREESEPVAAHVTVELLPDTDVPAPAATTTATAAPAPAPVVADAAPVATPAAPAATTTTPATPAAASAAPTAAATTTAALPAAGSTDIVISFDTTGSMYPCLAEVKRNVAQVVKSLFEEVPNLRIGLIAHGDYCDGPTNCIRKLDFSTNEANVVKFIQDAPSTGGGDYPECYELVLRDTWKSFSWRIEGVDAPAGGRYVKSLVMIGDAPPHEANENPEKIDWKEECERLRDRNIEVFSVQCLYGGNRTSFQFYSTAARMTNGYHLFLDQFSYVKDMIHAICFRQHDVARLAAFEVEVQRRSGGMTEAMRLMFDTMLGKKTREEVENEMAPDRYATRFAGGGFGGFGGGGGGGGRARVAAPPREEIPEGLSTAEAEARLLPCVPTKFQVFEVHDDAAIKVFCENMGIRFKAGRGFYEFTKAENIAPTKEIVLRNKDSGQLYEGATARYLAGLSGISGAGKVRPSAEALTKYAVFIQSTSYNRKLIGGTKFLYEVDDTA